MTLIYGTQMTSPDLGMSKMTSASATSATSDFQRGHTASRLESKFCEIKFYPFSQNFSQIGILEPFQITHFWFKTCTLGGGCFGLKISHSKLFSMDSENFYTNLFADHWKSCIFARALGFF